MLRAFYGQPLRVCCQPKPQTCSQLPGPASNRRRCLPAQQHVLSVPGSRQLREKWSIGALHGLEDGAQQGALLDVLGADFWHAALQPHFGSAAFSQLLQDLHQHLPSGLLQDGALHSHFSDSVHSLGDSLSPDALHAANDAASAAGGQLLLHLNTIGAPEMLQGVGAWASSKIASMQDLDTETLGVLQTSLTDLLDNVGKVLESEPAAQSPEFTAAFASTLQHLSSGEALPALGTLTIVTPRPGGLSVDWLVKMAAGAVALVVAAVPPRTATAGGSGQAAEDDAVPQRYDVDTITRYWARRPVKVAQRNAVVVSNIATFFACLAADWRLGLWEKNVAKRARTMRLMAEKLGPAYIKIAQALSTRVDIMPTSYIKEFQGLLDRVPPFDSAQAYRVMEEGLGRPVSAVFEELTPTPVASASLGQVYRGKLRPAYGGEAVAVKVQRPGVLEQCSLDIFIIRRLTKLFSQLPNVDDNWAGVLDDWALRFFQEMDYQLEAWNMLTFKRQMAGLRGVTVPDVWPELTSRKVLVTGWVEGERLSDSSAKDVQALCSTLLNCYLIQLLETGFLHADPHPGNLLRTPDGRVCILDFGLMTEVSEEQRIALVEYIAHLTMQDWDAVAGDLITLGFIPDNMPDPREAGMVPLLGEIMSTLVKGGGTKHISIAAISSQMEGVSSDYKMVIPPYFALILRAFSTIEGIALKTDEDYGIVMECLPYLSRRLLTDDNPRIRAALHQVLYGGGKRLDLDRLQRLLSAFGSFTTAAAPTSFANQSRLEGLVEEGLRGKGPSVGVFGNSTPAVNDATKEALRAVFSKEGTYPQQLLVEELVAAVDALSREALGEALRLVLGSATTLAALQGAEALGPLRAMFMPLPLPVEVLCSMAPAVKLSDEDRQALVTIRGIMDLLAPSLEQLPGAAVAGQAALRTAGELLPLVPDLIPGVRSMVEQFIRQLVRRMALRLAEDLAPHYIAGQPAAAAVAMPPGGQMRAAAAGATPSGYGAAGTRGATGVQHGVRIT